MPNKAHVNLTLDPAVLGWIDTVRGQKPRSAFINNVLTFFRNKSEKAFNWEKEEFNAEQDIKKGRVRKFNSAGDAIEWLKI